MSSSFDKKWQPLQEAVSAWANAVTAADLETYRTARSGIPDPAVSARLLLAIESARLNCERVSLEIQRSEEPPTLDWGSTRRGPTDD